MTIGLGTGSTTTFFIKMLGDLLRQGTVRDLRAVPTSEKTADLARDLNIPLIDLAAAGDGALPVLDLAVDGADEVDPDLNLIKGLGRALLREKIVEIHARELVVIVDDSKIVPVLGTAGPVPVEIVPFAADVHVAWLRTLNCRAELWREADGQPIVTDNNNYLARCWFEGGIPDCRRVAAAMDARPGIVEHGLFVDMATTVIVAAETGVRILTKEQSGN
jgi:ribose 5-phosphate isomerase A